MSTMCQAWVQDLVHYNEHDWSLASWSLNLSVRLQKINWERKKEWEKKRGKRRGYLRECSMLWKQGEGRDSNQGCGWVTRSRQVKWSGKALHISTSMSDMAAFFAKSSDYIKKTGICKLKYYIGIFKPSLCGTCYKKTEMCIWIIPSPQRIYALVGKI